MKTIELNENKIEYITFVVRDEQYRNINVLYEIKEEKAIMSASEIQEIRKKKDSKIYDMQRYFSLDVYNDISIGYVTKVNYDENNFTMDYQKIKLEMIFKRNEETNEIDKVIKVASSPICFTIKNKRLKTKNKYKFVPEVTIDNVTTTLKKKDIHSIFGNILNLKELYQKTDIISGMRYYYYSNSIECLWDLFVDYRDHNDYIKLGIGFIGNKEDKQYMDLNTNKSYTIVEAMEKFDFFREKVQKYALERKEKDIATSEYQIFSEFPSVNKEYYKIEKHLTEIADEYYVQNAMTTYYRNNLIQYFVRGKYSIEEIDEYFQAAYRQAYKVDGWELLRMVECCNSIGLPIEKFPKDMHIYINIITSINNFLYDYSFLRNSIKAINDIVIDNIETDNANIIKKALSYNNNFKFLNKILYHRYLDNYCITMIKDTDYFMISDDKYKLVTMYEKDKEVKNQEERIKILNKYSSIDKKEAV